jgi:hypothetical protein
MSQRVRVRRLSDEEGRSLQRIVRGGGAKTVVSAVRYRRATVVLASAGGNTAKVIARLVQTSPDRVREMIHRFNEAGMDSLDPKWAGSRPRRITTDDVIYVILDNLSAHKGTTIKAWCAKHNVKLCFTPTYSSWANPIECHFGPLRDFVLNNSDHPSHTVLTGRLHAYLRWRNTHDADPRMSISGFEPMKRARGPHDSAVDANVTNATHSPSAPTAT